MSHHNQPKVGVGLPAGRQGLAKVPPHSESLRLKIEFLTMG